MAWYHQPYSIRVRAGALVRGRFTMTGRSRARVRVRKRDARVRVFALGLGGDYFLRLHTAFSIVGLAR